MKGDREDWRRRGNQGRETWEFEGGEDDAEGENRVGEKQFLQIQ